MRQEDLDLITESVEGYEVKNLVWKPNEKVIRGKIKCPFLGKPGFNDGFINCGWRKNGSIVSVAGDIDNKTNVQDLYLKIDKELVELPNVIKYSIIQYLVNNGRKEELSRKEYNELSKAKSYFNSIKKLKDEGEILLTEVVNNEDGEIKMSFQTK